MFDVYNKTEKRLKNEGYKEISYDPDLVFDEETDYVPFESYTGRAYAQKVSGLHGKKWGAGNIRQNFPRLLRKNKAKIKKVI